MTAKRLDYVNVQIETRGGVVTIARSKTGGGWVISFNLSSERTSHGADLEAAAEGLGLDIRYIADGVCADLQAFIERNK